MGVTERGQRREILHWNPEQIQIADVLIGTGNTAQIQNAVVV